MGLEGGRERRREGDKPLYVTLFRRVVLTVLTESEAGGGEIPAFYIGNVSNTSKVSLYFKIKLLLYGSFNYV